jgi:hypothetical protein
LAPRGAHPLVWGAAAAGLLSALGGLAGPHAPRAAEGPAPALPSASAFAAPCRRGFLPDGPTCVPLPELAPVDDEPALAPDRSWPEADRIPPRPDRPADPLALELPLASPGLPLTVSRPTGLQTRTDGVRLEGDRNAEVRLVPLVGEEGQTEVVFVGEISPPPPGSDRAPLALATRHEVREAGRLRVYVVLYDHLARIGPGVVTSARVAPGQLLGVAAPTADGERGELYVETRLVREGASLEGLAPKRVLEPAISVATDVRNVFPREGP